MDINCDMGESYGNWRIGRDDEVMPLITTANAACGFHGGDPLTMLRTAELAREHGVAVGAHPGLPDLLGFGRRRMAISPQDAYAYVVYQAGALEALLRVKGMALHHVKPHGAMYHMLGEQDDLAASAADAVVAIMPSAPVVYWPAPLGQQSFANEAITRGVRVVGEVYFDLDYSADGRLVLQREKVAIPRETVAERVRRFVEDGCVKAQDGTRVPIEAESICVHGDGPNVIEVLETVHEALTDLAVPITAVEAAAAPQA
jgi:UPF0271 protein